MDVLSADKGASLLPDPDGWSDMMSVFRALDVNLYECCSLCLARLIKTDRSRVGVSGRESGRKMCLSDVSVGLWSKHVPDLVGRSCPIAVIKHIASVEA